MKWRSFFAALALAFSSGASRADDFGCTVLLCLANPAGPMAVAECVPPIKELFRRLLKFKPFPTCVMSSGGSSNSAGAWAEHGYSPYDPCPSGTSALGVGEHAVQGSYNPGDSYSDGIGNGDPYQNGGEYTEYSSAKVCVGNKTGEALAPPTGTAQEAASPVLVGIYDRVVLIDKAAEPHYIDVYVNNALNRRVRVPY